ncbi:galactokinase [Litorimonas sp. RW-G-Af-16]|uniref:galactokinase n=1 Tax=Litorimonas sp. RW-G-Af-16 TaxID=3241168 RepID=UPI00390C4F8E
MIRAAFETVFSYAPAVSGFTPGRVNLIGEHLDYNGGMVLPMALGLGVTIALAPRTDSQINIASNSFDGIAKRTLTDTAEDHWSDYVTGAVIFAQQADLLSAGADVYVTSTLPHGAGLSSSAAIIVGVLKLAAQLSQSQLSPTDIAILSRKVENDFIGVPCGIMDQMAVAIAKPGQALALNTQDLSYQTVDLPSGCHMAVIHSGHGRQLNEGRYKERADECAAAKTLLGRDDLCHARLADLNILEGAVMRRARHCVTEHVRTVDAVSALREGDMEMFGALMNESHVSMRDDFEMSIPEIDALVSSAVTCGALGARLTGGGFGGCIVACVEHTHLDAWTEALTAAHPKAYRVG